MSINVTVNGNPVCVRRRVVLSDWEQIKKNERERRRRLRLEQVREQSKEMSSKLLDRAKNIAKKTLNDIENDKDSKLRRMHDKKIMEIQQKYQEDMEDIGLAHASAAAQPDVEVILETERRKNQLAAAARGREASQQLKESAMQEDPAKKQQERLRQVREIENVRSSMIANLSKRSPPRSKGPLPVPSSVPQPSPASTIPLSLAETHQQSPSLRGNSSKKRKHKKTLTKKSPSKLISKPATRTTSQTSRPTQRIVVEVHQKDSPPDRRLRSPEVSNPSKPPRSNEKPEISEFDRIEEIGNQEIIDKNHQYNPTDYQQKPSSSSSTPSVSDDSSYFSDGAASNIPQQIPPKNVPLKLKSPTKPISPSKVHLYDYNTRHTDAYNRPPGVVERLDVVDEPNAIEVARKASTLQSKKSNSIQNQRAKAQQRGTNAALRERVKKDYHDLIQKLDRLSREEQKLKASQRCHRNILNKQQRQLKKDMKQAEMNRAFESSRSNPIERIITIPRHSDGESMSDSPCDSVYERSDNSPVEDNHPEEPPPSRNEQILEMLKKVERQKRLLLQEFGATLPDSVFNASMTRLFDTQRKDEVSQGERPEQKPESPEIKIIKVPETIRKPQRTETAVQTSHTSPDITVVNDKSTQVELLDPSSMKMDSTSEPLEYVEPIVRIIHPEVVASSSDSSAPGILIDFSKQQVKVTPTKRKLSKRKTPKSLPTSGRTSPVKRSPEIATLPGSASASAPTSRVCSPQEVIEEEKPRKYKLPERKNVPIADTSTDVSFGQPPRQREQGKSYVRVKQTILKRYYNNTSDTSTSYASLPAVQPGSSYPEAIANNMTPILQMLDSSANDSVIRRFGERDISPVSTPETPSPRILRIPSNVPDAERLGRVLRFDTTDTQEATDIRRRRKKSKERERPRKSPRNEVSYEDADEQVCRCKNPLCRLVHQDLAGVKENLGPSKPETLKKYDELQNICTERIASLNALIKQVRDEQQEDYSLTAPSDDTSLMQMPAPRPRDSIQSVQKLVESIEAIHNQLAKTLQESQKIITGSLNASKGLDSPKLPESSTPVLQKSQESPKSPSLPRPPSSPQPELRKKPTVISEETVKINLQRFRPSLPKKEVSSHPQPSTSSATHDDIVEKLSLEILEQTKSSEKMSTSRKKLDSPVKREMPKVSSPIRTAPGETFVPLLAGIPKAPKPFPNIPQGNGHRRPPPVNHPLQYGIEALSPPHELSTIAEFDTPDTGNRSHISTRSPTGKSRRPIPLGIPQVQEKLVEEAVVHESKTKQSSGEDERAPAEQKYSNGSVKSTDSAGGNRQMENHRSNKLITSSSSNSFSGLSGISEIVSTPTSDAAAWASSPPEYIEDQLRKLGLGWASSFLRKTRKASALSSSSSSDISLHLTVRRNKSPVKKNESSTPLTGLPDFSDVSSISIKEASKSTERAVLMKGRTSTPNIQNSNYSIGQSAAMTTSTATTTTPVSSDGYTPGEHNQGSIMTHQIAGPMPNLQQMSERPKHRKGHMMRHKSHMMNGAPAVNMAPCVSAFPVSGHSQMAFLPHGHVSLRPNTGMYANFSGYRPSYPGNFQPNGEIMFPYPPPTTGGTPPPATMPPSTITVVVPSPSQQSYMAPAAVVPFTATVQQTKVSCYNCGSSGHHPGDCKDQTMEDLTKRAPYRLDYSTAKQLGDCPNDK
ncbi:uncharacterized protein LOC135160907 [Diachasmimorpha longicaudata]|uniref:uncharacterized protein LOC135160907 n=1 Tax=Diachasmimorpha longicaudata TaxID=58733 RepID=UPI0030B87BB3